MRLLAVTAVAAEADAVRAGVDSTGSTVDTVVAGIGPAAAAAATSAALAADRYDVVVSAGIAGGFDIPLGTVVVASRIVAADLGVETADGFEPIGVTALDVPAELVARFAAPTRAITGAVLSVSTVTGTAVTTAALLARHPDAVAEAMEGFGVATAAAWHGVPFAEIRTISNTVGPRNRASWRIPEALHALTEAFAAITKEPL
ncbi:MAG TPA: futalosine hydrolase [Jatrophihabitantaceae bacterium]